jgi:hypothetical protein
MRSAVLLCGTLLLAACDSLDYEGWLNKPVPIALVDGIPLVQLRFGATETTANVDTSSPLTLIEVAGSGARMRGDLRLQDGAFPSVTRFVFRDLDVYDLPISRVGMGDGIAIRGVLGAPLLRNFAVRLSYGGQPSLTLKDEIPDSNLDLAADCDPAGLLDPVTAIARNTCQGVFGAGLFGGGLVTVGGETEQLPPSRIVVPVCLAPASFDPTNPNDTGADTPSGVPAMAVLATGLGTSVLSRSLVERLRGAGVTITETPGAKLHLPYGMETGSQIQISQVAMVSDETIELGPCAELARRRRQLVAGRQGLREEDREKNGASAALISSPVDLVVLEDARPLIQGLRQELSPYVADVDLVLGGSFLQHFEVDLDYPAARLILQCAEHVPPTRCQILPFCSSSESPRCPAPGAR